VRALEIIESNWLDMRNAESLPAVLSESSGKSLSSGKESFNLDAGSPSLLKWPHLRGEETVISCSKAILQSKRVQNAFLNSPDMLLCYRNCSGGILHTRIT
jgi:hypothetical protein